MNVLTAEAKRALRRWASSDYYVYLRPLSGSFFEKDAKEMVWIVNVEVRQTDYHQIRKQNVDLSAAILAADLEVPLRPKGYKSEKPGYAGWLAPQLAPQLATQPATPNQARAKQARKQKSRRTQRAL